MKSLSDCRLYAFVDTAYLHGRAPDEITRRLCDGGTDLIQLRAKHSSLDEIRRMAQVMLPITTRAGVGLVINDHLALARELGANYCHLGQEDFFDAGHAHVSELKPTEGPPGIGLSTHSPAQAARALAARPDYIAVGPVFATPTKPKAPPVTLDYVRWAAANVGIPWFAIGGINLQNLDQILDAGARRICVVSAILDATDITQACRRFKQVLK